MSECNKNVMKKIERLMEGKCEFQITDLKLAGKIGLSERSELAKLGFVVKHDGKSRLPNYIFRKGGMEHVEIDKLSHEEMAKLWRFAEVGHPYFDRRNELSDYFASRFQKLGGMTLEVSKKIGWEK